MAAPAGSRPVGHMSAGGSPLSPTGVLQTVQDVRCNAKNASSAILHTHVGSDQWKKWMSGYKTKQNKQNKTQDFCLWPAAASGEIIRVIRLAVVGWLVWNKGSQTF